MSTEKITSKTSLSDKEVKQIFVEEPIENTKKSIETKLDEILERIGGLEEKFEEKFDDLEEKIRKNSLSLESMNFAVANGKIITNGTIDTPGSEPTFAIAGRVPGQRVNSYY